MRVGIYIDGLNLYYGGRSIMGRGQSGWRWLDLRKLSQRILDGSHAWLAQGATLHRIVYCTAFIEGSYNAQGRKNQDRYIAALRQHGSFDVLEKGKFVSRLKTAPLATKGPGGKPVLTTSAWPVMVRDAQGHDIPDAVFMASHQHWEEKSTDVNVASRLLLDVVGQQVDAAIVISNDSDLRLPIQESRLRVPVGTVNPSGGHLAGDLRGKRNDGVGGHWWYQLTEADFRACQLPDPVGELGKPTGW